MSQKPTKNNYVPLNCKTHYSVLEALSKPDQLADLGFERLGIADNGTVSGAVKFLEKNKGGILGSVLTTKCGREMGLLAKNKAGWYDLIKITSLANSKENFDREPLIDIADLKSMITDNLVVIYLYEESKPLKDAYFGIDLNENGSFLRKFAADHNYKTVCFHSALYSKEDKKNDYEILLCIKHNLKIHEVRDAFEIDLAKPAHVLSSKELSELGYTNPEIAATLQISSQIEDINLFTNPSLPKFENELGIDSKDYLQKLCNERMAELFPTSEKHAKSLKEELSVINGYNLADYFLIIRDIINWVEEKYGFSGVRGSASGCLVSYLIGITTFDPLKHELFFSRFLNAGRFTKDRVQLPDIDVDVPAEAREGIIQYIVDKYSRPRVAQILTYQTIKGSAAIKHVFKAHDKLSFQEINEFTKLLPAEHRITDKLKEMGDRASIIRYALETQPDDFMEYARIEDGEIVGEFADLFKQAIRLEKTNTARGKHAAGIIVGPEDLCNIAPMIYDKNSGELIVGLEFGDAEKIGLLKLDLLGLRFFDKLRDIAGDISEYDLHN